MDAPSLLSPWTLEPLQIVPTVVAAALYFRRTRTLAAQGRPVRTWKQWFFWTGIALTILALNSPVDALGEEHFFFMHMAQHVILGDLAPLCFLVSLTPDANDVFAVDGFAGWWEQVQAMPSYQATTPRFS